MPESRLIAIPIRRFVLGVLLLSAPAIGQELLTEPIEIREGLGIASGGRSGRTPLPVDPVFEAWIRSNGEAPEPGGTIEREGREPAVWESIQAGEDGTFQGRALAGGYLRAQVDRDEPAVAILEASGHAAVLVNGEPRPGDPYSHGYVQLPVLLKAGTNELLFRGGRGQLRARLVPPRASAQLNPSDATTPDFVAGEPIETWAAMPVLNASETHREGLVIESALGDAEPIATDLPAMVPLSARKLGFRIQGAPLDQAGPVKLVVRLLDDGQELDRHEMELRVVTPDQTRKRTFISGIDGSVQYYGHVPMSGKSDADSGARPALFLSLHGASVEAIGQANAYAPKDWGHLIAPTNRRPYGFDWEDWGRLDAMEVLDLTASELDADPDRVYLTGHSMGGHGTWHLGVTYPGRFAAIAPSAGWISMWSYAGARLNEKDAASSLEGLLARAAMPSDTLALKENYRMHGVYVLHGDADDNVPVDQARTMRTELAAFHPDFVYREQPGAGHWWGNACVDWPPLFDFFREHRRPAAKDVRSIDFTTANPGVSSQARWAAIESQRQWLRPSRVQLAHDPARHAIEGETENVGRLRLDLSCFDRSKTLNVTLDGQPTLTIPWPDVESSVWLTREGDAWAVASRPDPGLKGPHRAGPFKDAFRNRMLFVYATGGTPEENAWSLARARYDAEAFGYQGNGSVELIADSAFDPTAESDRNVIVYGHADMNKAWESLLAGSPVRIGRGRVTVGDQTREGDDLIGHFVRPRPGSDLASVGVIAGTGLVGCRASDRLPIFNSGTAYPDFTLMEASALKNGLSGLVAAGYFGADWSVESGEFAWRD